MTKVLVIQGAGMNMRGKAQIEIFGTTTLDQINQHVRDYARELHVEVEIFHSNIEGEVVNALYAAHDGEVDAVVINPAGYTTGTGPLLGAIAQVRYPVIEVHASNPTSRGTVSKVQPVCKGSIYGFGVYGYYLALEAAKNLTSP
ncbi:MAG: type II 3-dehydroquinate dehydratase [Dehalococcoidia bacterium]